ncbi:hypothetical protein DFH28DRAFT_1093050 [Melampsora americana]|nr:hypothetical protein DFH28DRAFT_1093050 [Melampsora americana]
MALKLFKDSFTQNIHCLLRSICLGYLVKSSALPHLQNITESPSSEPENLLSDESLHSPLSTSDTGSSNTSDCLIATKTDLLEECSSPPLSPQVWQDLELNEFLLNYPGGELLNLLLTGVNISDRVNLTNFECGIGKTCYADQLCQPVRGKEWYILLIDSIEYKISDFYPDSTQVWDILKAYSSLILSVIKFYPTCGVSSSTRYWYEFLQGEFGMLDVILSMTDAVFLKRKWISLSYKLSEEQQFAQMAVANLSQSTIQSGISTRKGIYRVLKDGRFLVDETGGKIYLKDTLESSRSDKREEMGFAAQLQILAALWIEQNVFVTRGDYPCIDSGLDGAWPGRDVLSYCGPDNIMMNIVQANGNQEIRKVHNAHLINQKYNISVEYLTQTAWGCHKSGNVSDYDSWNTWASEGSDYPCSFNLPLCDLTRPDIQEHKNRRGTVEACRVTGQLAI